MKPILYAGPILLLLGGILGGILVNTRNPAQALSPAQSYDLSWSTIDGGGHTFSTGGDYSLGGTVGQPDPGLLTGGDYTLGGGFWGGGAQRVTRDIYLPVVLRSYGP
jgi:hypothetical protein